MEVFAVGVELRALAAFAVGVHADFEAADAAGDADAIDNERSSQVRVMPELALPVLNPKFWVIMSYSACAPVAARALARQAGRTRVGRVHAELHSRQPGIELVGGKIDYAALQLREAGEAVQVQAPVDLP